jgi:hypothetical protein
MPKVITARARSSIAASTGCAGTSPWRALPDDDGLLRGMTRRPTQGFRQALLAGANRPDSWRHRYHHRSHRQASLCGPEITLFPAAVVGQSETGGCISIYSDLELLMPATRAGKDRCRSWHPPRSKPLLPHLEVVGQGGLMFPAQPTGTTFSFSRTTLAAYGVRILFGVSLALVAYAIGVATGEFRPSAPSSARRALGRPKGLAGALALESWH